MLEDIQEDTTHISDPLLSRISEKSRAAETAHLSTADEDAMNELAAQLSQFNWKDGVVDRAKRLLYSQDIADNIKGALSLKAMLCIGREEVYEVAQEVIDSGVISRLVEFLKVDNRDLQWPAAFCLTNVAAGHDAQTQTVVDAGAIDPLIKFLRHSDSQLRRQAIFCLANVAGSTSHYRTLLARNPDYFPAMFHAGLMASDNKVLELICWNLRNVCLLGGPSFQEVRPGIEFFLNHILRKYWSYQHWSACVRFAVETIGSVCRTPEGRTFMQEANVIPCLLSLLEMLPTNSMSTTQFALEALCWLLFHGTETDRELFVHNSLVVNLLLERAVTGQCGAISQELSLKIFACIAAEPHPDVFISMLQNHEPLDVLGQVFLGLLQPSYAAASVPNNSSSNGFSALSHTTIRECAAFLFSTIVRLSPYIPTLIMKIILVPDIVKVLLEILDFAAEQLCYQTSVSCDALSSKSAGACNGPSLPALSENLTVAVLKAILTHLQQGALISDRDSDCGDNPVAQLYLDVDTPERIHSVIRTVSIPQNAFEVANVILKHLTTFNAQRASAGYGFSCLEE